MRTPSADDYIKASNTDTDAELKECLEQMRFEERSKAWVIVWNDVHDVFEVIDQTTDRKAAVIVNDEVDDWIIVN